MNTYKAIYHTKTQEEFDWLMQELEKEGCNWKGGRKPTEFDVFDTEAKGFHIFVDNKEITYGIWENYRIFHKGREYVEVSDIMTKQGKGEKRMNNNEGLDLSKATLCFLETGYKHKKFLNPGVDTQVRIMMILAHISKTLLDNVDIAFPPDIHNFDDEATQELADISMRLDNWFEERKLNN